MKRKRGRWKPHIMFLHNMIANEKYVETKRREINRMLHKLEYSQYSIIVYLLLVLFDYSPFIIKNQLTCKLSDFSSFSFTKLRFRSENRSILWCILVQYLFREFSCESSMFKRKRRWQKLKIDYRKLSHSSLKSFETHEIHIFESF